MDNFFILLHGTQLPENTGMVMRAMANTGIKNLRLINIQHEWPSQKAHLVSAEKSDLINVEVFSDIKSAISDMNTVYAASARPRNMIMQTYSPDILQNFGSDSGKIGVLFGSERNGLSNEDISFANAVIRIPSHNFSSYNLAQAVLIICYHMMQHSTENEIHLGKTNFATQRQIDSLVDSIESKLATNYPYWASHIRTIRNFFKRSSITQQEINSLFGAINKIMSDSENK